MSGGEIKLLKIADDLERRAILYTRGKKVGLRVGVDAAVSAGLLEVADAIRSAFRPSPDELAGFQPSPKETGK